MNILRSFTETVVTTPTDTFPISFEYDEKYDAVHVFLDDVAVEDLGYIVSQVNAVTLKIEPAIPSGTVRIERETDIDKMLYIFDAGALFIDQNVDADFRQIVHSQQEVRDGFIKLRGDVLPLVHGLEEALKAVNEAASAAKDAADAAVEAAEDASDALAKISGAIIAIDNIQDLLALANPKQGQVVHVRSYHAGWAMVEPYRPLGGGTFYYDTTKASVNNGVYIFNGWVRLIAGSTLSVHDAGARGDKTTSDSVAINKLMQSLWDLGLHSNGQLNPDSFTITFEGNLEYYLDEPILQAPNTTLRGNGCTLWGNARTNNGIHTAYWVNGVLTDLTPKPLETQMLFRTHIEGFLFKEFKYSMNLRGMTFGCSVVDCSTRGGIRHINSIEHYFLHVVRNKAEACELGYYFSTFSGMLQFQTVSASNCTLGFHFASAAQAVRISNIAAEQCTNGIFIEGSGNTGGISIRSSYFEGISGKAVELSTNTYGSCRIGDSFVNITGTLAKETGNCKFIIEDDNWLQSYGVLLDASTSTTSRSKTIQNPVQHNGGSSAPNSPNGTNLDKNLFNGGSCRLWACNTHEQIIAQKDTNSGNTVALHRHYFSAIPYQYYGHQGTPPSNVVPFCSHTANGGSAVTNIVITTSITANNFSTGMFNLELTHGGTNITTLGGRFYGTNMVKDVAITNGSANTTLTVSGANVGGVLVITVGNLTGDSSNYRCRGLIKLI
ncbi:tailspike protein [Acinetobacter phage APK86]|uniref:Tailspike protein n=1 Tax=Acinetobacter phage APK86 TaxID=2873376 RepID=A0AAE8XKQ0_9CAUD|nr:tailspike protein [Acinetobacter phage APK86]